MRSDQIGPVLWLVAFVGSGIGLGQTFELLQLHAGPARYDTFFLCLLGYWANFLVGGLWVVWTGSWRRGRGDGGRGPLCDYHRPERDARRRRQRAAGERTQRGKWWLLGRKHAR